METLNIIGTWWVPSKGQSRAAGTLTFSENEGVRLEIDKSLTVGKEKIIIGRAGGRDVTLQGCYEISSTSVGGALKITGQEYLVETAFLGVALTKTSQFRFTKASFDFTHLIDWVATSGIKTGYSADKKFTVTYQRPDDISITLPEATLSLAFSGKYPFGGPTLTIQESVRWDLTTKLPKTIDEIVNAYITPLWDLLRLTTMRDNTLEELAVYRKANDKPSDAIRVIFKTGYVGNRTRHLSSSEMLFSLRDIGTSSLEFLKNWIQIHPNARAVIDNLVDPPTGAKVRLTQRFFNLVQAAEVYHRLFHSTQSELSKAEHDKRLSEILSDVRDTHKDWLKQILADSNKPRLAARLTAILKETELIVRNLLPNSSTHQNVSHPRSLGRVTI